MDIGYMYFWTFNPFCSKKYLLLDSQFILYFLIPTFNTLSIIYPNLKMSPTSLNDKTTGYVTS